jgi:predicted TIM-barrel fold metal-dependent hydrolase
VTVNDRHAGYRLISADSHINEPPDLWTARLPAKYRDRAPRIERFEQGDAWVMEGALDPINFGSNCSAGIPAAQRSSWITWDQVRAGGYDPSARLTEQDADGVDAEILYPTPRIGNQLVWHVSDPEFHLACIRAYNDWLSEYASHDPARLWGAALMPNVGTDEAIAELQRVLALPGIRAVLIGQYPHGGDQITRDDDAFWAAAEEAGVPVSIHVAFATEAQGDRGRMKLTGSTRFYDVPVRVTQFVESGVFDRFPALQLVLVEVDSSWTPYLREQMDDRFQRANPATRPDIKRLPSEYFTDSIATTFITDPYAIVNRHYVGLSQMMWSSDYPHGGSDWPESRAAIDRYFDGVPEGERHQILAGNALRIYGAPSG